MVFKIHSNYFKYHYHDRIQILVVKCTNCGKYHAIIPSFSVPGTSQGTAEVEDFTENRAKGQSRAEAGKKLLEAGISFKHLKHIEKMFQRSTERMKAIFAGMVQILSSGLNWCQQLLNARNADDIIYQLNTYCLDRGVNAVFCNRANILIFQKTKPGSIDSNDLGPVTGPGIGIDSS
ncbi:MAG TPA: hypothetical protein VE870_12975 [Bacteroidales bacterium]|nr:hypothetical protein [Bacteroidales bacterium]